jgi:hypothetical protein
MGNIKGRKESQGQLTVDDPNRRAKEKVTDDTKQLQQRQKNPEMSSRLRSNRQCEPCRMRPPRMQLYGLTDRVCIQSLSSSSVAAFIQ